MDQAARDAARLSTEDAPCMFDPEIGVIATPIGTPEIEDKAQIWSNSRLVLLRPGA